MLDERERMTRNHTFALPIARMVLRALVALNWAYAASILVLILMPHEQWIMRYFELSPGPRADRMVAGLRIIAVLGLVAVPLNHAILRRLVAIVETVRDGNPFVSDNADRLRTTAWSLLALQVLSTLIGQIAKALSTSQTPVHLSTGFSVAGWLAVLLTFILAAVFREGTKMRDELAGIL